MNVSEPIRKAVKQREVSRLCHFTQARNLPHIFGEAQILSTAALESRGLPVNPNDTSRLDGYKSHISCSMEYANAWFLAVAVGREVLFRDWIILDIHRRFLWADTTLFCPVNAAKEGGRLVSAGLAAFHTMFDLRPPGSMQNRGMLHLKPCPTDDQAEVLVGEPIGISHVSALICASEEQVHVERSRLELLGHSPDLVTWKAAPEMFDARLLAGRIRSGERAVERIVDG